MKLNWWARNDQVILEIFSVKESHNMMGRENFWVKTQGLNCFTKWNNSINLLFLWMPIHMQKIIIIAYFGLCHIEDVILEITFRMPRCASTHPYEWTKSYRCTYVHLNTSKKSKSYLSSFLKYSLLVVFNHFQNV